MKRRTQQKMENVEKPRFQCYRHVNEAFFSFITVDFTLSFLFSRWFFHSNISKMQKIVLVRAIKSSRWQKMVSLTPHVGIFFLFTSNVTKII